MKKQLFDAMYQYMLQCMTDSAHDPEHVRRVLYTALDIARTEPGVNYDILIAACLLHDIGREEQLKDPSVCHAQAGSVKARNYLLSLGWTEADASAAEACILTHRYRASRPPQSLEAKILFDADKLDVCGALGIARTLLYQGETGVPLYTLTGGMPSEDGDSQQESFFQEYHFKLKKLYGALYTNRGRELAAARQKAAEGFYESLKAEIFPFYEQGNAQLEAQLSQ